MAFANVRGNGVPSMPPVALPRQLGIVIEIFLGKATSTPRMCHFLHDADSQPAVDLGAGGTPTPQENSMPRGAPFMSAFTAKKIMAGLAAIVVA